jgi:cytochrome P450
LGAHLAKLEARELFGQLIARFRKIGLAGEPRITPDLHRRGVISLPVTIA